MRSRWSDAVCRVATRMNSARQRVRPLERMNSPLEDHEVRLRGLGGRATCGVPGASASAPGQASAPAAGALAVRRWVFAAGVIGSLVSATALVSAPARVSAPPQEPAQAAATPAAPDAFVWATARYESGDWNSAPLVPTNLLHSIAQYTSLPVASTGVVVDLASPELFRFPFVFLTGHLPVRFNQQESANLKAYVERGGFIFIDDHNHDIDGGFHKTATAEVNRIFGAGALKALPKDHELYRSFFVFPDGPPTTSHELNGWGDNLVHEALMGVEVNGRLGVLYSNKDYSSEWNYHARSKRQLSVDNTRFGVNVAVYALTR